MSVSYSVDYDCTVSGSREDFEKIPAIVRKISDDKQAWWGSLSRKERANYWHNWTSWYEEDTEAIAAGAEEALSAGGPLSFEFWTEEDDSSHSIMDDIMNTLDKALPGLAISLSADLRDYPNHYYSLLLSPPGQSSLNLNESRLFSSHNDWKCAVDLFQGCEQLTCLELPEYNRPLSISSLVFKGCVNLTDLILPRAVTKIAKTAFKDCKNLTIHAPAGSYAEEYAKERGIPFQLLDE